MSARVHFLLLSPQSEVKVRIEDLSSEFHYQMKSVVSYEELQTRRDEFEQVQFVLLDVRHLSGAQGASDLVKQVRKLIKETFICVVVGDQTSLADCLEFKKNSANMVLFDSDLFGSSRLEYVSSQVIRANFVPVKTLEFQVGVKLDFTLYHLMPLNQKLVAILPKGIEFDEARKEKLDGISEVFVRRDELDRYRVYVEAHPNPSVSGIQSRCRAQYLSYCNSHAQLIFSLIDQAERESSKEGKWLFDRCEILGREMLTTLSSIGESWDVVNNSSLGEFGSIERSPTVAAYAGILSLLSSIGDPGEVMLAGLLSDIGMLSLKPSLSKKLRQEFSTGSLYGEEQAAYQNHPLKSIEIALQRKLPLKESVKDILLATHERADGNGFPNRRSGDKIPLEAMIIQYSEMIDRKAMIRMGSPSKWPVSQVRKDIVALEMEKFSLFSEAFVLKIKPVI